MTNLNPAWQEVLAADGAVFGDWFGHQTALHFGNAREEAVALSSDVGLVDLSQRTRIELVGKDRATFLHNMCTADIKRLTPGAGSEAMLLDARGHVQAYAFVLARDDSLLLDAAPGQAERLMAHLDRYIIREDVQLADRSSDWAELLVAGPRAESLLREKLHITPPADMLACADATELGGGWLARVPWSMAGAFSLFIPSDAAATLWQRLQDAAARPCGREAFEAMRIEAGIPISGQDVTDKNLPQELARDRQAINFTKGCYIGQETVARIDALGHVNKTLCGVRFSSNSVPPAETELTADGQVVGNVTSSAWSPQLNSPLAFAWLRRGHNTPGVKLSSNLGEAEVVALPVGE